MTSRSVEITGKAFFFSPAYYPCSLQVERSPLQKSHEVPRNPHTPYIAPRTRNHSERSEARTLSLQSGPRSRRASAQNKKAPPRLGPDEAARYTYYSAKQKGQTASRCLRPSMSEPKGVLQQDRRGVQKRGGLN